MFRFLILKQDFDQRKSKTVAVYDSTATSLEAAIAEAHQKIPLGHMQRLVIRRVV